MAMVREPTFAERARQARQTIERATAIVDGEVIRAATGVQPAIVRATRVLKGPAQELFAIGQRDSCDIGLVLVGERRRYILVGGPELYFLPLKYSNDRAEDRILRSDRRRVWPYRQGEWPSS
jgi:hypothetical protein